MIKTPLPKLKKGEVYVGSIIGPDGRTTHTILLPGEKAEVAWNDSMVWAKDMDGDLPTRIEQAILWAYHRDKFEKRVYWSNEQSTASSDFAWTQNFSHGTQSLWPKDYKSVARAVRRVVM